MTDSIESVAITWLSGQVDRLPNLSIDQIIAVQEGLGVIPHQVSKDSEPEMNFARRRFLGSSLVILGSTLLDALTTPIWKWKHRVLLPSHDERVRWGAGCTFLDYDRDGHLDLFLCNYIRLDPAKTPMSGDPAACQWKGIPVMCGPRGLPGDTNVLYHNNGDGTFTDVSQKSTSSMKSLK